MPVAVIILVVAAVVALVLIIVAPWRRVRSEGRLPSDVQARILLGEDPAEVAAAMEPPAESKPDVPPPLAS